MDEIGRVSLIAVLEKCISQMNKAADGGSPYQPCSHQYEHNHKNKRLHHDDAGFLGFSQSLPLLVSLIQLYSTL